MLDNTSVRPTELVFGSDVSSGAVLSVGASVVSLFATVALFVLGSPYDFTAFTVFVGVTALGWYFHQAEIATVLTGIATLSTLLTVTFITIFLFLSAVPAVLDHGLGLLLVPEVDGQPRWFFFLEGLLPTGES